mgnify:CR=1 FL=1
MKSIFELGVSEVYSILKDDLKLDDLPPLDAIENEDWGRDLLLSRLVEQPVDCLNQLGLTLMPDADPGDDRSDR